MYIGDAAGKLARLDLGANQGIPYSDGNDILRGTIGAHAQITTSSVSTGLTAAGADTGTRVTGVTAAGADTGTRVTGVTAAGADTGTRVTGVTAAGADTGTRVTGITAAGADTGTRVTGITASGANTAAGGTGATGGPSVADTDNATLDELLLIPVLGAWAVDRTATGGGLCGQQPEAALTSQGAAYAVVYDHGTTTYALLSASAGMGGGGVYTANFQVYPDAEAADDAVYFGADIPFPGLFFPLTATVGVYANDSAVWEYWNGAAWAAVPAPFYDNTDSTAQDGLRPFQAGGTLMLGIPADWAATTVNGQLGYYVRSRITAAQVTTPAIMADEHCLVIGEAPWTPPHAGTLTALRITDAAATLHTAADVIFELWDSFTGEHRTITFAQDRRRERVVLGVPWALTTSSLLHVFVVQEDGTNEPTSVMLELEFSGTHKHGMGAHTHTGPSHDHAAGAITVTDGGHDHAAGAITVTDAGHDHAAGAITVTDGGHDHAAGAITVTDAGHDHAAGAITITDAGHDHAAGAITVTEVAHAHTGTPDAHTIS